jgi:hypothetical protein
MRRTVRAAPTLQVCHSKVEELVLPEGEKVDVLVSEPMGTLLVNERMLETYLYARDHFLKPGGKLFPVRSLDLTPQSGHLFMHSLVHVSSVAEATPVRYSTIVGHLWLP